MNPCSSISTYTELWHDTYVQALYFGSVPRCNARLRQLFDYDYVRRHYLGYGRLMGHRLFTCPGRQPHHSWPPSWN